MKFSTTQITKAGEIVTTSSDKTAVNEAITRINEWRELHLPVIELLMKNLHETLACNSITPIFSSFRLKRMTSIQYKLDMNPTMGLGRMQDIAGGRFVFTDVETLRSAYSLLRTDIPSCFEIVKQDDYVENPKPSGYRSIHLVYRYLSPSNEDWDRMIVEIQLRTKLQHCWAMAVETAGLVTNTALKSGQGSDEWQEFFQIVSCLFSTKEKTPLMAPLRELSTASLINRLQKTNTKHNFFDRLLALKLVATNYKHKGDIFLLFIDFNNKRLQVRSFNKDEKERANELYNKLESLINDKQNAAVLVSVSSIKELKEAYPSYFLDMEEFNKQLKVYLRVGVTRSNNKRGAK